MTEAKTEAPVSAAPEKAAPKKRAPRKATTAKKPAAKKAAPKKPAQSLALNLPNNPLVFEILDLASRQRTTAKKVEVLHKYANAGLKAVLIWNFDETLQSALPDGKVPYGGYDEQNVYNGTLSDKIDESARQMYENGNFSLGSTDANARTTIRAQARNLYHFVVGGNGGLSQTRREMMFINLLESLHPLEADVIVLVKDKLLTDSYKISKEVVSEAYPEIRGGGRG